MTRAPHLPEHGLPDGDDRGSDDIRVGDRVAVRTAPEQVFSRTPRWSMGRTGRVVRRHGSWPDPDRVARGDRSAPAVTLYQVEFALDRGGHDDRLVADLFEHWLIGVRSTGAQED